MKNSWPEFGDDNQTKGLVFLIFLVLWLASRCYNIYPMLNNADMGPRLSGADSYFHLRHANYVLENYPHIKRMDDMSAYPYLEPGLNQGFFDLFVATLSKLSFGLLTPMTILLWNSPLLSAAAAMLLGGWLWKQGGAWLCTLFFALFLAYPGPLSQVAAYGNGDHHAFELLLAAILILVFDRSFSPQSGPKESALTAFVLFIFYLSWPGAALHLFFLGCCFFLVAFQDRKDSARSRALIVNTATFALTLLALLGLTHVAAPSYVIWWRSELIFAAGGTALLFGYPPLVLLSDRLPRRGRPILALALVGAIAFLVSLSPAASDAAASFFGTRSEAISEQSRVTLQLILHWYGINLIALLAGPLLLARQGLLRRYLVPVSYGVGLSFFWLWTRDFYYYTPLPVAALTAYCLWRLPWKKVTPIAIGFLTLVPLIPLNIPQQPWHLLFNVEASILHTEGLDQTAQWLKTFKANQGKDETYGMLCPWDLGSTLAAISDTPVGHSQTHSERLAKLFYNPNIEDVYDQLLHYGDDADRVTNFRFVLIPSVNMEQKFGTELKLAGYSAGLVYSKLPPVNYGNSQLEVYDKNENFYKTFLGRLFDRNAAESGHFRLVFQSPKKVIRAIHFLENMQQFDFRAIPVSDQELAAMSDALRYKNQIIETSRGKLVNPSVSPEVKLFEIVPGALLKGKVDPHQPVEAFLGVKSPYQDEIHSVSWKTYADSDGAFSLRVPYSTGGPLYDIPGTVQTNQTYLVRAGSMEGQATVTEEQVQSEGSVEVVFKARQ